MPISLLDGFDHYATNQGATTGGLNNMWTANSSTADLSFVTGLGGQGKALNFPWGASGNNGNINKYFTRTKQLTLAFAVRVDFIGSIGGACELITFRDSFSGSFQRQFGLAITPTGKFVLTGEGSAIVAQQVDALTQGQVYRFNMTVDLETHDVVTKINGAVETGLSGNFDIQDHSTVYADNVQLTHYRFFNNTNFITWVVDDFVVIHDELRNLPPIELFTMAATDDVLAQWTRLSGTKNAQMIDDIPFDVDVTYNSSNTVGQKDIFQFGALPRTPEFVLAVSAMNLCRKDEAGVRQIKNMLRIGATEYPAANVLTLAENYTHLFTHWENNPVSGVPFVAADFPLQMGYELVA